MKTRLAPPAAALVIAAVALALAACGKPADAPPGTATAATEVADGEVSTHVKTALLQEPTLAHLDITVVTAKGDVRLSGIVDTQAQIDTAQRIVTATEGSHTIHNELTLRK